jgi:hypothetical protein
MSILLALLLLAAPGFEQGAAGQVIVNPSEAKWVPEKNPPGAESVTLREDAATGVVEYIVRYPAGHKFSAHWHNVNERIFMIEGKLAIGQEPNVKIIEPGGYAFLPKREVQYMSCVSTTRCTFYLSWDGKTDFNKPPVK